MSYDLGVDLGTTYSAAAIHRDGRVIAITLGNRAPAIPSVVLLREDGDVLTGESASRRAIAEPDRVAREFKRRLGDPTPLILGTTPYSAESLTAKLLRWIVDAVTEREGEAPRSIALTHPANWGDYKRDLLHQAVRLAGLHGALLISEPEAAAIHYASLERIVPGTLVAVYDLGGGTFDAAVLRKREDASFEVLGRPEGIERLGGIDFDEAIFRYVLRAVGDPVRDLDPDDPAVTAALARLREECTEAKEALSSDTEVAIPVILPTVQTEVRLTRSEFEAMIRPTLADTIGSLRRALQSAGVEASALDKVLLVGGSSRIPVVAQMISAELDRPVAVDADPKLAVAGGAALAAADAAAVVTGPSSGQITVGRAAPATLGAPEAESAATAVAPRPGQDAAGPTDVAAASPGSNGRKRRRRVGVAAAVAAVLALAVAFAAGVGRDARPEVTTGRLPVGAGSTTLPTTAAPQAPFVSVVSVATSGNTYAVSFTTRGFGPNLQGQHIHFFWNTVPRVTAGTNGVPAPGKWLVYAGPSPVVDRTFRVAARPDGATAICALIGNHRHEIADVDGDGRPDPDTGGCADLPS